MPNEKRILHILALIVVIVVLFGIVLFKYMSDREQESTLATVLYIVFLLGSLSSLAIYYINTKRDKDI